MIRTVALTLQKEGVYSEVLKRIQDEVNQSYVWAQPALGALAYRLCRQLVGRAAGGGYISQPSHILCREAVQSLRLPITAKCCARTHVAASQVPFWAISLVVNTFLGRTKFTSYCCVK